MASKRGPTCTPWDCPDCGLVHPKGCHGHVDECINPDCLTRMGNAPGQPCVKCDADVNLRPCRQAPILGGHVCWHHGGAKKQTMAKAARKVQEIEAAGEVAQLRKTVAAVGVHPLDSLLEEVQRSTEMTRLLWHLVGELDLHPVTREVVVEGKGGTVTTVTVADNKAFYGPDHLGDNKPHVLVEMLRSWTDVRIKACKAALDAGIDERRLRLQESEVEQLLQAMTLAANDAGLTTDQRQALFVALASRIRDQRGSGHDAHLPAA